MYVHNIKGMIVIASHVKYQQACTILLQDLHVLGVQWNDVAIVVAGSDKDLIVQDPRGFVVIQVTTNFFELSAVYGIAKYLDHDCFKEVDHFVFLQDTVQVRKHFLKMYGTFVEHMKSSGADVYYASADRKCNIAGLSRTFIAAHGLKYGITADKDKAWKAEHNGEYSFVKFAEESGMKVVDAPTDSLWLPGLVNYPDSVIKRCMVYFAALDLFKLVATCDEGINPPWQERCSP
jgi:hypothetical protein